MTSSVSRKNSEEKETSPTRDVANGNGSTDNQSSTNSTEYFANTNVLTCRLKWVDPDTFITDPKKSQLLTSLNQLVHSNKGLLINPKEMENYQYFSDHERIAHLKENLDVYLFERGNVEVDSWYRDSDLENEKTTWFYDVVIQAQFKPYKDLQATKEGFLSELTKFSGNDSKSSSILECWSISENPHALNHPGNLYVRGIPKNLTKEDLIPIFAKFGPILVLKIILDSNTNESMGFGFVSYALGSQASNCIKELNGNLMNGSPLFVNYHVERKERERIHFDQWKQNEQEESTKFKGVFVGNLPIFTTENKLLTPSIVLEKFKKALPDCEIVSYFFPKTNSQTNVEYSETDEDSKSELPLHLNTESFPVQSKHNGGESNKEINEKIEDPQLKKDDVATSDTEPPKSSSSSDNETEATNEETCSSQNEESPLKGYGFFRFATHEMALKCIETFNDSQWYGHQLVVNKAIQKFHQHQHSYHGNSSSSLSSMNNNANNNHHHNHHQQQQQQQQQQHNNNNHHHYSGPHQTHHGHASPHQPYYQQPFFPPMYSFRLSRRHSDRAISSRQSNAPGFSPPPITPIPLNEPSYNRNNASNSRSISRQNSVTNIQHGSRDQPYDPHSPPGSTQNSIPPPSMSQPVYPVSIPPPPTGIPGQVLPPLVTQSIPVLTNSSTNSTGSPRNNSIYGPMNMPLTYSSSNPMFNTPLPIPRSDEQESNLYVKHLPLDWRDEDLYQFFEKFGEIISAKIITVGGSIKEQDDQDLKKDELFGKSKGYGFVCFQNPLDASRAMYHTDGLKLNSDNTLFVSFAQRRSKSIDSIKTPVSNNVNYNKKFLNAMYQQQQQQYHPWVVPVPMHYPPPSH